jgi:rRNA maturation endonuclease Nob1
MSPKRQPITHVYECVNCLDHYTVSITGSALNFCPTCGGSQWRLISTGYLELGK